VANPIKIRDDGMVRPDGHHMTPCGGGGGRAMFWVLRGGGLNGVV